MLGRGRFGVSLAAGGWRKAQMVVGVLRLVLVIPGARSLKEKRHAVRKITDRVRARYNVGIAEVAENDVWQRAVLGVAAVANDRSFVNEVLDKVVRAVEMVGVADLVSREMEIETYSSLRGDLLDKPRLEPEPAEEKAARREEEEALREYLREEDLPAREDEP